MTKNLLSLLIIGCLFLNVSIAVAQTPGSETPKQTKQAEKIKKLVFKSGVGPGNDIEVTLKDKSKVNGYVSEIADNHFIVTDPKTGSTTLLSYDEVHKVSLWSLSKNQIRRNFSSPGRIAKNIGIGIAIGFSAVALVCVLSRRCVD